MTLDLSKIDFSQDNLIAKEVTPPPPPYCAALVAFVPGLNPILLEHCGFFIGEEVHNIGRTEVAENLAADKDAPTDGVWVWYGVIRYHTRYYPYRGDYDCESEYDGKWRRPTADEWGFYRNEEHVWLEEDLEALVEGSKTSATAAPAGGSNA